MGELPLSIWEISCIERCCYPLTRDRDPRFAAASASPACRKTRLFRKMRRSGFVPWTGAEPVEENQRVGAWGPSMLTLPSRYLGPPPSVCHKSDGFNRNDQPKFRAGGIAAGRPRPGPAGRERAAVRIGPPSINSQKAIKNATQNANFKHSLTGKGHAVRLLWRVNPLRR